MKAILLSIKPRWVAKILNGEKTIEVRKRFPKDYKGWVYIYCSKTFTKWKGARGYRKDLMINDCVANGKVVARFYCDKVEEIYYECGNNGVSVNGYKWFYTETLDLVQDFEKASCLNEHELFNYLQPKEAGGTSCGYAIHISQLEIFDRPKELSEFRHYNKPSCESCQFQYSAHCDYHREVECDDIPLTKAPQNMVYIEVEE